MLQGRNQTLLHTVERLDGVDVVPMQAQVGPVPGVPGVHQRPTFFRVQHPQRVTNLVHRHRVQIGSCHRRRHFCICFELLHSFALLCQFCTSLYVLHFFISFALFYQLCTSSQVLHFFISFAIFYQLCTSLSVLQFFISFALLYQFCNSFSALHFFVSFHSLRLCIEHGEM